MSWSRRCVQVKSCAAGVARLALVAAALSAGGCASDEEFRREREAYVRHQLAQQQALAGPKVRETELEDDGLPSQVAPPANRRHDPDDPSEPFSRNYGRSAAAPQRTTLAPSADDAPTPRHQVASY